MAEDKDEKLGDACHLTVCKAENGYKLSFSYEHKQSLSERNGWVPSFPSECKDYVEKTKAAVIERIKKCL